VIESFLGMLNRTLGDHITLSLESKADKPANIDRSLFESAILNLTLNARDAMPNGGLLSIRTEIADLSQGYAIGVAPGEYVCVSVSDTGGGMAQEVLGRAFEPFFTTKAMGKGTGMGLSMVYGFAKQSGGHVTIESRVGSGTSVRLYLPVASGSNVPRPVDARASDELKGGSERILLVEDEPQLRRFVSAQLRGLGYQVTEAEAGAPAIAILDGGADVDLLFTDVMMPGGISGFELVARARAMRPGIKVLLTTGYAAETDRIADIRDLVLKKPYKKQQLAETLRQALDDRQADAA
jgi:CheY-like chemotaxis protein